MPKRGAEVSSGRIDNTGLVDNAAEPDDLPAVTDDQPDDEPTHSSASPRTSQRIPRGFLTILSGAPGFGKSSLSAEWPGPILLMLDENDRGILDLIDLGRINGDKIIEPDENGLTGCPIITNDKKGYSTWWKWMELFVEAVEAQRDKHKGALPPIGHEFKYVKSGVTMRLRMPGTILSESLSGFETAVQTTVVLDDLKGNWDFATQYGGSQWASKAEAKEWPRTLRRVGAFRELGIHWNMTCHSEVVGDDSEIADMKVRRQKCHKRTINVWQKDANLSAMIAMDVKFDTVKEDKRTGAKSGKAERDAKLKLVCTQSPVYLNCKNHFGITSDIILPTGPAACYNALCKAAGLDPKTFRPRKR